MLKFLFLSYRCDIIHWGVVQGFIKHLHDYIPHKNTDSANYKFDPHQLNLCKNPAAFILCLITLFLAKRYLQSIVTHRLTTRLLT